MERIILHIDMDAFFAAVEERDKPRLKGKPIVVGADPKEGKGRGVVATANYAARKYGIHSALPISTAWRLAEEARACGEPKTVFISGRHSHYDAVSKRIMAILRNYSLTIQQVSIDEAYTQLRFSIFNSQFPKKDAWKHAEEVAGKIKKDILKKEKLTCSIGIGPNKLIAKIASDAQKPDGLTIVTPSGVQTFLDPKDIRVIPGIGPKAEMVLNNMGARTISELREIPLHKLTDQLGKLGASIYQKARGDDESPLTERHEVKSISEQETYEKDTLDPIFLVGRIKELARQVHLRAMKK